ncbi:Esterase lipase [Pyrenophora tritici-repentis]|uniref:Esterase-lipase n=1 Tax=Pyrenophora tritici-repentis TaxID=45151 RepID=A0A2W1H0C6_9PLEO|nr:Lipid particle protein [Pyrenophora tritici-repentis]KAF7450796.1 Lipid particle protein [Pyrenophora tritici-repentis]KAF7573446.1 Esterase-lipase [Pyrenophora tritici-repentis]KAI0577123.1 Lipid particle protein [Pyrenophora tritici-repentis]KAI0580692.1 Lipid particle protein [Pyrenophora tritici-repentis]
MNTTAKKADHLCVLVHGLWGVPEHLKYVSDTLSERFPQDKVHVLVTKRNAGTFTYDGVNTGGERVAEEVEDALEQLADSGHDITKISIVGYSLGGLIARYAIGLLYHRGVFEKIQPVNFTTFATPHLGVRTPLKGYPSHLWNVLAGRTLSLSGRQLFCVDQFKDTGRPLLAVLADPESIFIRALAQFKHRSLYANIRGDRSVTYYTAAISRTDPYVELDSFKINYISGYEEVIVDSDNPVSPKEPEEPPAFVQRFAQGTRTILGRASMVAVLSVFIPIGVSAFLIHSAVQSIRSHQRIQLHEQGKSGIDYARYRIPLMIQAVEHANHAQGQEYLSDASTDVESNAQSVQKASSSGASSIQERKQGLALEFPTLALTDDQFKMIEALDSVGFKKNPVYIHKHRHSHAAIIVRTDKSSFDEGRVVVKHWLDNFEV